jgi:hypothetical protein
MWERVRWRIDLKEEGNNKKNNRRDWEKRVYYCRIQKQIHLSSRKDNDEESKEEVDRKKKSEKRCRRDGES